MKKKNKDRILYGLLCGMLIVFAVVSMGGVVLYLMRGNIPETTTISSTSTTMISFCERYNLSDCVEINGTVYIQSLRLSKEITTTIGVSELESLSEELAMAKLDLHELSERLDAVNQTNNTVIVFQEKPKTVGVDSGFSGVQYYDGIEETGTLNDEPLTWCETYGFKNCSNASDLAELSPEAKTKRWMKRNWSVGKND